jgi:ribosomal-protein-alanine N-acetyltransferase
MDLLNEANERGCSTVLLEVAEDSPVAIELYRSVGFETISARPDYYAPGRAALIMRRRQGSDD